MPVVILPADVHRGIIERWTTPTDRLIAKDKGHRLPDGSVEWDMPELLATRLQEFMFEGESYEDAIERLLAEADGRVS